MLFVNTAAEGVNAFGIVIKVAPTLRSISCVFVATKVDTVMVHAAAGATCGRNLKFRSRIMLVAFAHAPGGGALWLGGIAP